MKNKKGHSKLWLYFTGIVFSTIFFVSFLFSLILYVLYKMNVTENPFNHHLPVIAFGLGSLLLGVIIALFVGKVLIVPIQNMSHAFKEVSKGNFSVKMEENQHLTEIQDMAKQFNAMTFDLSHIETLQNDFVVNVSHEFKTPIAAIDGYATLLQNKNLSQEKRQIYVEKILDNAQKLSVLSSNILLLSKLENQSILPPYNEYRLDEQIRNCILRLENKWIEKEIDWNINLENVVYYGCQSLLEQVWSNLLDNAIKHSFQKGQIQISLQKQKDTIQVRIQDFGDGMSEEIQKHIFEKFYQADTSRKSQGNGLGLSLVKRILDLCQGSIQVQSQEQKGALFIVELPINEM